MKIKANQTTKSETERINNSIKDRTTFFYYAFRNILLVGLPLLVISGFILSHLSFSSSATSGSGSTDSFTVSISSACTISSVVNSIHNIETNVGTYVADVGKTTIKTLCNDGNGYAIYANGYSNNEEGNNKLINSEYPQYSIDTGLATSGLTSTWAMKLNNIENDPSPTPPVIESNYNDTYGLVPQYWTKVAGRTAGTTDMDEGSSFTTTYSVYASSNQHAGSYVGEVKYILLHPSTEPIYPFMQDVANWSNTRLPNVGNSIQAIDQRDGKKYWVTRLADGNVWMTQNLDFNINSNTILNSTTTDLNAIYNSSTGQYAEYDTGYTESNNIIYWTPASTAITIGFQNTGPVTGWINSNTEPYSASKTDSTETGHASLGNYYNWTAAIASNNSSSLTQNTLSDISKNPKNSICPKGWRLPTISNQSEIISGSTNEFARLNYIYNSNSSTTDSGLITSPLYFVKSGNVYVGNLGQFGIRGSYWSSTPGGVDAGQIKSYFLEFESSKVQTAGSYYRVNGRSVRCVAR